MKKSKTKDWIDSLPIPYYIGHVFAVMVIMFFGTWAISFDFAFGSAFTIYIAKEITQFEYEKEMDWKGLLWPVGVSLLIYIIGNNL